MGNRHINSGGITVFLSLVLVIMISLLFTVIDAARNNTAAFQTEVAADAALQSSLAEYNKNLLTQYDLFFVDIGYGTGEGDYILLEQHIRDYMQETFEVGGISLTGAIRDLIGMSATDAAISQASGAADGNGAVLERSALDYMEDLVNLYDPNKLNSYVELASEFEDDGLRSEFKELSEELEDFDDEDNPIKDVSKVVRSESRILNAVTGGKSISGVGIDPSQYISSRGIHERSGFLLGEKAASIPEDLIFQKYMMDKCANYTREKPGSRLKYQMEYVLKGKSSDQENLKAVVNNLVTMRLLPNYAHLSGSSDKQSQIEALALACPIVWFFPELLELIKAAITLAWTYSESMNDVRVLLNGGKIPAFKDSSSWQLSLLDGLTMRLHGDGPGQGLCYDEYLHILLAPLNKNTRNLRFMDIIEMDVREAEGSSHFRIDNCVNAYTATLMASSSHGAEAMITRTVGFKK